MERYEIHTAEYGLAANQAWVEDIGVFACQGSYTLFDGSLNIEAPLYYRYSWLVTEESRAWVYSRTYSDKRLLRSRVSCLIVFSQHPLHSLL